jgi:transposase-like protein
MDFIRILLGALKALDTNQLLSLKRVLFKSDITIPNEEFIKLIQSYYIEHKPGCPHCKSLSIVKFGFTKNKSQRFKCYGCCKTFSAFTDTPLSYTKKSMDKWVEYINLMSFGESIRRSASSVGINIATSFQWRHKILRAVLEMLNDKLDGIIEIDEVFLAESFKGNHSKSSTFEIQRNPRKRGMTLGEYLNNKKISVLCCRDRKDSMFARTADRCKTRFDIMFKLLGNRLPKGSTLCTNNNMAFIPLSKILNCRLYKMRNGFEVKEKKYHIQNVGIFGQEIKSIIEDHFKGVATRYLNHYLVWIHWMAKFKNKVGEYKITDMLSMIMFSCKTLRIREFCSINSIP